MVEGRLVALGVQGGAEAGRGRHVSVEKALVVGVEVLVTRQAGTVSAAVGAVVS